MNDITTEDVQKLMRDIEGVRQHMQSAPVLPIALALETQLAALDMRRQDFIDQMDGRGVEASDPRMVALRASDR